MQVESPASPDPNLGRYINEEEESMSLRIPTLMTAGLLGLLLAASSFATVQAGDGCTKDKKDGRAPAPYGARRPLAPPRPYRAATVRP